MPAWTRSLVVSICAGVALFANSLLLAQPAPEGASGWRDRAPVTARQFMIAAANPLAVDAGHAMLARGGSAVDAAIAAQLVLGLVEPQSSGIGGGGFMLVHDAASRRLLAYDGRETAPAAAKPDRFLDRDGKPLRFLDAVVGGRSVGVPGTMALLEAAHRAHGRAALGRSVRAGDRARRAGLRGLAAAGCGDRGRGGSDGQRPRPPVFRARDRRAVAGRRHVAQSGLCAHACARSPAQGADAFYRGEIARDVVATANGAAANPGDLTLDDLGELPSQGARAGLRTLSRLSRVRHAAAVVGRADGAADADDARAVRPRGDGAGVVLEHALHCARPGGSLTRTAGRTWPIRISSRRRPGCSIRAICASARFGDPADGDARPRGAGHAAGDRGSARRKRRVSTTASSSPSTSHLSIVDAKGNAVSFTTTIENAFGSRLMTEGGFLLNNELTDFIFRAGRRRQAGRQSRRGRQAPALVDGADDRLRRERSRLHRDRLARRQLDHQLRR